VVHVSVIYLFMPANIRINFSSPETTTIVLPDTANRMIVSSFVWTKHRNVTDGQNSSSYIVL